MALTQEQRDWLTLSLIPGIGTARFVRLLARFHTPGEVLKASVTDLADVVEHDLALRIVQYKDTINISEQERALEKYGASLITMEDAAYPVRLAEIYDPPLTLFTRGNLCEADEYCIAIVGTRRPTSYGLKLAEQFAEELAARGITIVSGMARGIDAAAHRGALRVGGRTIAVLGNGVDIVFPPENKSLMDEIIQNGCVISQFAMGMKPRAEFFPYRNRIISGLSMGTLVVEAPTRSGALITAQLAAEQGREVFAIPGPVHSPNSRGPHRLIQEGAKLVQVVEDILVELETLSRERMNPQRATSSVASRATHVVSNQAGELQAERKTSAPIEAVAPKPSVSSCEASVLAALTHEGSFVDEIAEACGISISEALSSLTMLEMKGLVRQFNGKRFAPR